MSDAGAYWLLFPTFGFDGIVAGAAFVELATLPKLWRPVSEQQGTCLCVQHGGQQSLIKSSVH